MRLLVKIQEFHTMQTKKYLKVYKFKIPWFVLSCISTTKSAKAFFDAVYVLCRYYIIIFTWFKVVRDYNNFWYQILLWKIEQNGSGSSAWIRNECKKRNQRGNNQKDHITKWKEYCWENAIIIGWKICKKRKEDKWRWKVIQHFLHFIMFYQWLIFIHLLDFSLLNMYQKLILINIRKN